MCRSKPWRCGRPEVEGCGMPGWGAIDSGTPPLGRTNLSLMAAGVLFLTRLTATLGWCTMPRRSPKRTPTPSRYVSIKFAAERAGVSTDTIRRMIADGTLAASRFRGQIRIAIEDIDAAMWPIN
ncbi:excisionase family DNA-binding protein [Nocardia sp. JW2]|uniref:excisionase family DNA-binding protein n=1 Tax=Nocardia sp. JW2 TaxID=3450738 RepID=UPI003F423351